MRELGFAITLSNLRRKQLKKTEEYQKIQTVFKKVENMAKSSGKRSYHQMIYIRLPAA
jgi:hypothetical protein